MKSGKVKILKMIFALSLACAFAGCSDDDDKTNSIQKDQLVSNVIVPSSRFYIAQTPELTIQGRGFLGDDSFYLRLTGGDDVALEMKDVEPVYIRFSVPSSLQTGEYILVVKRGNKQQQMGILNLRRSPTLDVADQLAANVKGVVFCGDKPVVGAVVSDGDLVAVTDANGHYWLESQKHHGYVFVSFPSGYEPLSEGSLPLSWQTLTKSIGVVEQHNFELIKVDNDNHVMLALADMHLASRSNNDLTQFRNIFVPDAMATAASYADRRVYAMNVGDMTWDGYWYSSNFAMPEYVANIASHKLPFIIFHAPGNHDNDPYQPSDLGAEKPYKKYLGPTYYSFNIGKVHYVMLDDNIYVNSGAVQGTQGDKSYKKAFTDIQIEWLKRDLALVDAQTPVVIGTHCPINYFNSSLQHTKALETTAEWDRFMACLDGFANVQIISGHTHNNVSMKISDKVFEHNTAAVCATWWWTVYHTTDGIHICKDGSPGGYGVYEATGENIEWYLKGCDIDKTKQFRTYDMNTVKNYFETSSHAKKFLAQFPGRNDYVNVDENTVFINVWNWDQDWTVKVTEGATELPVSRILQRDPLHTICYDIPRLVQNGSTTADFLTSNTYHMFSVMASNPSSTLVVEVTDRFGNVYTERMARPKTYSTTMD